MHYYTSIVSSHLNHLIGSALIVFIFLSVIEALASVREVARLAAAAKILPSIVIDEQYS